MATTITSSGADLLSHGDNGPAVGQILKSRSAWVESDFTMTKSALLAAVFK